MSTGGPGAGRLVRALVLPALLVAVAAYAVQNAARTPQEPPPAAADPLPLPEPLGELWGAWGKDLSGGDGGTYPAELASLDRAEALYVLLSVRAAQVAEAVAQAEPQAGLDEALQDAGLSPQPALVPVTRVPEQPGCVVLTLADEPFGRSYFGWSAAPREPGPSPVSALEAVLLRTARVGLAATDRATCGGGGVAYSLPAQEALARLTPELLR